MGSSGSSCFAAWAAAHSRRYFERKVLVCVVARGDGACHTDQMCDILCVPVKPDGGKDKARQSDAHKPYLSECEGVDDGEAPVFLGPRAATGLEHEVS